MWFQNRRQRDRNLVKAANEGKMELSVQRLTRGCVDIPDGEADSMESAEATDNGEALSEASAPSRPRTKKALCASDGGRPAGLSSTPSSMASPDNSPPPSPRPLAEEVAPAPAPTVMASSWQPLGLAPLVPQPAGALGGSSSEGGCLPALTAAPSLAHLPPPSMPTVVPSQRAGPSMPTPAGLDASGGAPRSHLLLPQGMGLEPSVAAALPNVAVYLQHIEQLQLAYLRPGGNPSAATGFVDPLAPEMSGAPLAAPRLPPPPPPTALSTLPPSTLHPSTLHPLSVGSLGGALCLPIPGPPSGPSLPGAPLGAPLGAAAHGMAPPHAAPPSLIPSSAVPPAAMPPPPPKAPFATALGTPLASANRADVKAPCAGPDAAALSMLYASLSSHFAHVAASGGTGPGAPTAPNAASASLRVGPPVVTGAPMPAPAAAAPPAYCNDPRVEHAPFALGTALGAAHAYDVSLPQPAGGPQAHTHTHVQAHAGGGGSPGVIGAPPHHLLPMPGSLSSLQQQTLQHQQQAAALAQAQSQVHAQNRAMFAQSQAMLAQSLGTPDGGANGYASLAPHPSCTLAATGPTTPLGSTGGAPDPLACFGDGTSHKRTADGLACGAAHDERPAAKRTTSQQPRGVADALGMQPLEASDMDVFQMFTDGAGAEPLMSQLDMNAIMGLTVGADSTAAA